MGRGSLRNLIGGGDSNAEIFSIFGPFHLTSIEWTDSYYRTSVASSLVSGVYTLEGDRLEKREGSQALAKPWWEFFNFTLHETLLDNDGSIYGAIFEYELYHRYKNTPHVKVPHYVIAFRGTVLKKKTMMLDLKLDFKCILNTLHDGGRSKYAVEAIRTMVDRHSQSAIWLAGHSLGAALVLLAGKTMTSSGFILESYIFNPPISSIPLEQLPGGHWIKGVFQCAKTVVKATAAKVLTDVKLDQFHQDDPKTVMWIPHLYVNPKDPICAGYIDYFRFKTFMSVIHASDIERLGAGISLRSLLVGKKGESDLSKEPLHLLPSADMTVNRNKPTPSTTAHGLHKWWTQLKKAHGLHQWWERDSTLRANWERYCIEPSLESN